MLPRHLAIIMDGNGRWARQRGVSIKAGHEAGGKALKRTIKYCGEIGIHTLSVFAFSHENWLRSKQEVDHLMQLFADTIETSLPELIEKKIQLRIIGDRSRLDPYLITLIEDAEAQTRHGVWVLVIALNYGGRQDIVQAARSLAEKVQKGDISVKDIDETRFGNHLAIADLPPPDLCIRTSNERRISNFMLWQLSYTELHFTKVLWPDFDRKDLDTAINDYIARQRRFGSRRGEGSHLNAPVTTATSNSIGG